MQPKLVIAFDSLSDALFQVKVDHILASLSSNRNFPEPWPEPVPSLDQLNEAFSTYKDAYHASLTHDSVKIRQRKAARDALTVMLKQLATYLELVAQRDTEKLATTGFDQRRDTVRGIHGGILPAADDFRVGQGLKSGTAMLHVARLAGAKSYEVDIAQGDPSVEENWKFATTSGTGSHMLVEGLTPGQSYWFRVRAIGSDGAGLWTDPISLIVV